MSEILLQIDGKEVKAKEGMTVLEAAQANGLYIPNLCNHPDLKPAGLCRVCVVKMDDWNCSERASGMDPAASRQRPP